MRTLFCVLTAVFALIAGSASAQNVIGQCHLPQLNRTFAVNAALYVWQVGMPMSGGYGARDPSGMTFMQLPSSNPMQATYFVGWQGELIEVVNGWGWQIVGSCQIILPPPVEPYFPMASPVYGVPVPGGLAALPKPIVDPSKPFGLPLIITESAAQACRSAHPDVNSTAFQDCMVKGMLGQRERAVFECSKEHDPALMSSCVVGALGGQNERQIAADFSHCYKNSNGSYQSFSFCMAGKHFNGDMALLVQCVSQQSAMGQVSVMGTLVCYGGSRLNLNPEAQIIVQCAAATGGQPKAFALCAGGQLTARELDKCTTGGVGGENGCFGPNNDIVKHLKGAGLRLAEIYGPLNPLVRQWNDGVDRIVAGARDDGVRLLQSAANGTIQAGANVLTSAGQAIGDAVPRITVGKPSVTIGGTKFSL